MKPGDNIKLVLSDIGTIHGKGCGWNVNGIKIAVYDSYTTIINWYKIQDLKVI